MNQITLYTGAGVTFSPTNADGRTVSSYVRLVADEGKLLKNGDVITSCVDVKLTDISNWTEIDEEEAVEDEEVTADEIAFALQEALS